MISYRRGEKNVLRIGELADDIEPVREPIGFGFNLGGHKTVIVRILERIDPAVGIADLPELPVPVDRQFGAHPVRRNDGRGPAGGGAFDSGLIAGLLISAQEIGMPCSRACFNNALCPLSD